MPSIPQDHPDLLRRFWNRICDTGDCWEWQGGVTTAGYGLVQFYRHKWYVHRLAYCLLVGPIPDNLTIDHLCRNRICVNPAHLDLVTRQENTRRELALRATDACPQGHPYTPENTYVNPTTGGKHCRTCRAQAMKQYPRDPERMREYRRRYEERRKAARNA